MVIARPQHFIHKTYYQLSFDKVEFMVPLLSTTSYFTFLSGLMITLFAISLVIIFVYEYEVLRRSKS